MNATPTPALGAALPRVFFVSVARLERDGFDGEADRTPLLEMSVEARDKADAVEQVRRLYPELVSSGDGQPGNHEFTCKLRRGGARPERSALDHCLGGSAKH